MQSTELEHLTIKERCANAPFSVYRRNTQFDNLANVTVPDKDYVAHHLISQPSVRHLLL